MDSTDEGEFVVEGESESLLDVLGVTLIEASREALSDNVGMRDIDGFADDMAGMLGEPLIDSMGVVLLEGSSDEEEWTVPVFLNEALGLIDATGDRVPIADSRGDRVAD
jgi:hypothetical protein